MAIYDSYEYVSIVFFRQYLVLSIVQKYVTELGGELWLESELGEGSTFNVKISI